MVDLKEKMKANSKQKKKNKKASGAGGPAPVEMNGESVTGGQKAAPGLELSGEDEEDEVSSTNSAVPPGKKTNKQLSRTWKNSKSVVTLF